MRKILTYLKEYKKECFFAPLFKLLEASFELIVPLVMAAIIDRGISGADHPFIFRMGGVLILLAAVGFAVLPQPSILLRKRQSAFQQN